MTDVDTAKFRLDLRDERLWRDELPVQITNKAFQLLRFFLKNPHRLLTKDEILDNVWPGVYVSEGLIKEYVHDLRLALGDDPKRPTYIETVRGRGYRFLGGIEVLLSRPMESDLRKSSGTSAIAVLPFLNISGDPAQDYLADGIVEDIIISLSKLSQLAVAARNSSFIYKAKSVKVEEFARELGVRYVIEGSIRKFGKRVRISLQLIDCNTGGRLWAGRFDRELIDILAIRDEVTGETVAATAVKLCPHGQCRLKSVGTENMDAYDHFLRGRELFWSQTKEANVQAKTLFKHAMDLAPKAAPPRAFLSLVHLMDYINGWTKTPEDSLEQSYELARKGIELGDDHPWSRVTLGNTYLWRRQYERAIAEYERVIARDPNFPVGYVGLGWIMHYVGRSEETVDLMQHGIHLDPHYFDVRLHWLAQAYYQLGRYNRALETLRRRLIRKPDSDVSRVLLAACYGQLGQTEDAQVEWKEAHRINPDFSLEHRRRIAPYRDPNDLKALLQGLRNAALVD